MLSKHINMNNRIYDICERSGEIQPGETFIGVRIASTDAFDFIAKNVKVVCCGKIKHDELLFRTEDGSYYFSICDGWGEEDGILYGLSKGISYDFKHPTTDETILAECEANRGTYHSWAGAMAYRSRCHVLDAIITVMKKG